MSDIFFTSGMDSALGQVLDLNNYFFNVHSLPLILTGLASLALGLIVLSYERFTYVSKIFFFVTFTSSCWFFGFSIMYNSSIEDVAIWWGKVTYLVVPLIASSVYNFTVSVLGLYNRFKKVVWISWIIFIIFAIISWATDFVIEGVYNYWWGYYVRYGWLGGPFILFFSSGFVGSLVHLWTEFQRSVPGSKQEKRAKTFLYAFGIGTFTLVVAIPKFGIPVYPLGFIPYITFLGISGVAIVRYRLVDITPAFAAHQILTTMSDAILVFDETGKIKVMNRAACEIFVCKEGDLIGRHISSVVDDKNFVRKIHTLAKKGDFRNFELKIKQKDGVEKNLNISCSSIRDRPNNAVGTVCVVRDFTDRKKAEEALRESEAKFRILAEESPNMIFINKKGRVIYVNKKSEETMGYSRDEFYSQDFNFMNLIAPEFKNLVQKNFRKHASGQEISPYEYKLITKDGGKIFAIHTTKLIDYGGEQAILGIITDITERKRSELVMKRRLMKFRLEDGKTYLVKESSPTKSLEAFQDLLNIGLHGVIISRMPEEEFRQVFEANFEFLWLAEKETENSLPPKPKEIESRLEKIGGRTGILIDRLDYLISKLGFKETLSFVQMIKEIAYLNGFTLILSIDPSTTSKQKLRRLEKEALAVVRRHEPFSEDLMNVLKCVLRENEKGVIPTYVGIGEILGVSQPTVRKKVRHLIDSGYLKVSVKGKRKFVEITENGKSLILK
jgi:PAS domain S-box-containing protein